jgi:hypothetical protein
MPEIVDDPQRMREMARRFREIALDYEREGSPHVAKKMRQVAVDVEAAADAIERARSRKEGK